MHVHKARLNLADTLYQKACDEYEIAFSYRKDYAEDLFDCTKAYDKLNNTEKTIKYLKLSIEAGCGWWNYNNDQYLPNLKRLNKLPTASDLLLYRITYYQNINIDYLLELEKLLARDQIVRDQNLRAQIADPNIKSSLIRIVDSANMVALRSLIEKYGFPEFSNVGHQGESDVLALLLHGLLKEDSLSWAYFQPKLLNAVKNGQLMPEHYALLYDRAISDNGREKQYYGVMPTLPIDDIENVDIRRKEIGLMPLEDELKIYHLPVPDGYIRK